MADSDAAAKEEQRLLKTMARKAPGAPSSTPKASSTSPASKSTDSKPSTSSPTATKPSPAQNSGSATKAPVYGTARSISTRTTSSASPSSNSKPVDEEAIRAREAAFEAERERLRQVEESLIRNGKSAIADMGDILSELEKQERAAAAASEAKKKERDETERQQREQQQKQLEAQRLAQEQQNTASSDTNGTSTKAPSNVKIRTASTSGPGSASSSSSTPGINAPDYNKSLIDDVDALLRELNKAAQTLPPEGSSAAKESPSLEEAKSILKTRKASVWQFLSIAMGKPLPDDMDDELSRYLRSIIAALKPVQDISSIVPLKEETVDFVKFARCLDALMLVVLKDLHLLMDHNSREMVSNNSIELLEKAIILVQEVGQESLGVSQDASGASAEDVVLGAQNRFNIFLKHLAESITNAAKKQVEAMQARRDSNSSLALAVQETAAHAQGLAEILKNPLFEPQAFKDKLGSLVTTIKRATNFISDGNQKNAIMDCTRQVLEASLLLQQQARSPSDSSTKDSQPSPHIQVFQALGLLLRTVLGTIQAQ